MNDASFVTAQFDLNVNRRVDYEDLLVLTSYMQVATGDANLSGIFNSEDLVQVMTTGEYEDGVPDNSTWIDGDWNCDGDFDAMDLVVAFQAGQYQDNNPAARSADAAISDIPMSPRNLNLPTAADVAAAIRPGVTTRRNAESKSKGAYV